MARKYGKNETTLSNVLKLVKALLALADEEIAVPGDKLKATFYVEWVKEDELLVSGKVQQKRNNRTQTVEKGITKEDLWTLVECLGEALELSQPKDKKKKPTEAERKANAVQDVLDCLKDLELFDDKRSATNSPYWKFHLKLKHQTARKEENLKVIKERWKIKIGTVTVETSHEKTFISKDQPLNWQEICRQNLALQKQLTTNPFTNASGVTPKLDKVYVRLAIVEHKPPKPPSRSQPEEKEEEKLIPIAEESFFEDVLRQGKSDISQGRKIAIIGEPGSGKTTRLQKIADWILEKDLGLPIWISLADLTQPTITQYIEQIWLKQTGKSLTIDELTQHKDRIWLLLDGLDEMTSKVEMRHVSALLGGWVQAARVVVTCRVNVWEADKNAFSGFDVFRNLEFNPEQVTDYIRRWFAGMRDAATGESLEAALAQSENSRLKELIQNPLRLWMLCQIWQTGRGLPETQAGLYGQFVDWVYRWKADEEILDQREAIDTALARLALAAMEQKDEVSRLRLPESWVVKFLGSRPIFQAVMKLGWLNRVERFPEAICVFYHTTFQEYFAALAVEDWDYFLPRNHVNFPVVGKEGKEKEYRIFEPQWKQVILLWLGRGDVADEEKEKFIEALVNFDDGCGDWSQIPGVDTSFYGFQSYFLATYCSNEFNSKLFEEILTHILNWTLGYFFDENKENNFSFLDKISKSAFDAIVHANKKYFIEQLIDLIENNSLSKSQISQIGLILGKISSLDRKQLEKLEKIFPLASKYTQSTIISSIKGDKISINSLKNQLKLVIDDLQRRLIAESILKIDAQDTLAKDVLIEITQKSSNELAKLLSIVTLEKFQPNIINFETLKNLILYSSHKKIRSRAILNLKIFQNYKCFEQDIYEIITQCRDEKEKFELYTIAANLGIIYPETTQFLVEIIKSSNQDENYWFLKQQAFYAICQHKNIINDTEIIESTIKQCLEKNNLDTAARLTFVFGQVSSKKQKAIKILESIITKTEDSPHTLSIQYLCQLDQTSRYFTLLINLLINPNRYYQEEYISDEYLIKIIIDSKNKIESLQMNDYIQKCKRLMSHIEYENNLLGFYGGYQFLWKIAQNLPYPDFYRAWHGLTETQTSPLV